MRADPDTDDEPRPQDTEREEGANSTTPCRRQISGCRGQRGGERRVTAPGSRAPCGDEEDILEPDGGKGCTRCDYIK